MTTCPGGSSDCKPAVFLCMYVGGRDELQPGGLLLHLPSRWILQTDCRRPPLSLPGSSSRQGSVERSESAARTDAVSFLFFWKHFQTQTGHKDTVISPLRCACRDDFVLQKLKKEAAEEGAFLVRWSALDYHRIILAVLNKNEVSRHPHPSLGIIAELRPFQTLYLDLCLCTEWVGAKPQAVSYPEEGLFFLHGGLGPRILQREGAHR